MQVSYKSKSKLTHNENYQKMRCNANIDIAPLIACKPETKKTGDCSNACVCLYMSLSLKLLTDDCSDFVAV